MFKTGDRYKLKVTFQAGDKEVTFQIGSTQASNGSLYMVYSS